MKKYIILIPILLVIISIIIVIFFSNNDSNTNNNSTIISGQRTSLNYNEEKEMERLSNIVENKNEISTNVKKERELADFTTQILDDTPGRLTNISITCSTLNNTIVEAGQTFSFNETVGEPTAEKGYQEAKIIIDDEAELGIGGGNCQVSSTLYDAVMSVPGLVVTERHEHGKDVGYVPLGMDATISYGTLDLKFRNETGRDIRIDAITDNENVNITIVGL